MGRATPTPGKPPTVLLAEDDGELRELLAAKLESQGAAVIQCKTGLELVEELDRAFGSIGTRDIDVVVTDIRMPGVTGLSALRGLAALEGRCPVIVMTAFGDEATHAEAERLHATAVFDKPFDVPHLIEHVWQAVGLSR